MYAGHVRLVRNYESGFHQSPRKGKPTCSPALPNQRILLVYSHFLTRYFLFVFHFLLSLLMPFRLDCHGGQKR